MATTTLTTVEDVERLPDDGYRYALIRGVLHRTMAPAPLHGSVAARTTRHLDAFAEEHGAGVVFVEAGFVLGRDPDVLLFPDVALVRADRLPPGGPWDRYPDIAPDLAIEIVSPSNTAQKVEDKVAEYLAAGVPLVWVLHPKRRTVTVRTPDGPRRVPSERDELDGGDVLPGFRLPVARLFLS